MLIQKLVDRVFAMDGESAAGSDGFIGRFFTFAWDVMVKDVCEAVGSFLWI